MSFSKALAARLSGHLITSRPNPTFITWTHIHALAESMTWRRSHWVCLHRLLYSFLSKAQSKKRSEGMNKQQDELLNDRTRYLIGCVCMYLFVAIWLPLNEQRWGFLKHFIFFKTLCACLFLAWCTHIHITISIAGSSNSCSVCR